MTVQDGPLRAACDAESFDVESGPDKIASDKAANVEESPMQPKSSICSSVVAVGLELLWTAGYYAGFLAVCHLAANCRPWLACVPLTVWSAARIRIAKEPEERPAILKLIGTAVVIGWVANTSLALQPWLPITVNACATMPFGPDPFWMLTFWVSYATFVDWVRPIFGGKWLICMALGAFFGPSSYLLGRTVGGIVFSDTATFLIAIEHGTSFPLLMWLSMYYRRHLLSARSTIILA